MNKYVVLKNFQVLKVFHLKINSLVLNLLGENNCNIRIISTVKLSKQITSIFSTKFDIFILVEINVYTIISIIYF